MWITFNEPGVQSFCGFIYGSFPPAHTMRPQLAGTHFCNMLQAHTAAYAAIKASTGALAMLSPSFMYCNIPLALHLTGRFCFTSTTCCFVPAGKDAETACIPVGGQKARVGLVHNYMNYAPISKTCTGHIAWACGWLNSFWGTQQILEYFRTGRFHYPVPMSSPVSHQEAGKPGLDFIGINYYSRCP